mgnify:CR=1 FL=1
MGGVAITQLPIAQYPPVAPPSIVINAAYPGASAQTLEDSVLSVIEREMNGAPGMAYMESVAQANGTGQITLSFEPGTNLDLAQVEVQNRLKNAEALLPAPVRRAAEIPAHTAGRPATVSPHPPCFTALRCLSARECSRMRASMRRQCPGKGVWMRPPGRLQWPPKVAGRPT